MEFAVGFGLIVIGVLSLNRPRATAVRHERAIAPRERHGFRWPFSRVGPAELGLIIGGLLFLLSGLIGLL